MQSTINNNMTSLIWIHLWQWQSEAVYIFINTVMKSVVHHVWKQFVSTSASFHNGETIHSFQISNQFPQKTNWNLFNVFLHNSVVSYLIFMEQCKTSPFPPNHLEASSCPPFNKSIELDASCNEKKGEYIVNDWIVWIMGIPKTILANCSDSATFVLTLYIE